MSAHLSDEASLDAWVETLPSPAALLPRLLESVPEARRAAVPLPEHGHMDVREVIEHGREGLWVATAWFYERVPRIGMVPHPLHERWDALVEVHRALPECAWLVARLLAMVDREPLADRVLLGVERRFGARGRRCVERSLEDAPLKAYVLEQLDRSD